MNVMSYEKVYTVTDYYDGERAGIADFNGQPHYYECLFDDSIGYLSTFLLHPIDSETFRLALEDWDIWERWNAAREEGRVSLDTHPALPEDRERHNEISEVLKSRLIVDPEKDIKAEAKFRVVGPGGKGRSIASLEVEWRVIS